MVEAEKTREKFTYKGRVFSPESFDATQSFSEAQKVYLQLLVDKAEELGNQSFQHHSRITALVEFMKKYEKVLKFPKNLQIAKWLLNLE